MSNNSEIRKKYMKDNYSEYWLTAREKKYGFLSYDKNLCNLILEKVNPKGKMLDVGVGTGTPFGNFFIKQNFEVHGIDISELLIKRCKELNPEIISKVGDSEDLEYDSYEFDAVYSFHCTWYFPNFLKSIDEMLRVTKKGGFVFFDISNKNNSKIYDKFLKREFENKGIGRLLKFSKNVGRYLIGRKGINWSYNTMTTPTYPDEVFSLEKFQHVANITTYYRDIYEKLNILKNREKNDDFERLIFVIQKC